MKQATRIPIPPLDYQAIRKPQPVAAPDPGLRGRLKQMALHLGITARERKPDDASNLGLAGWLKYLVPTPGARIPAHSGHVAGNRAIRAPVPAPPDHRTTPEPEPDKASDGFSLLGWLKHLALYLSAVTIICLIGLYFLWQIPFVRDPSQILKIAEDSRPPRSLATTAKPTTPTLPAQAAPSPSPVNTAAPPRQPASAPTDTIVAATSSPATLTDSAGASIPPVSPSAVPPASPAEPAPPTTELVAEAVPPPTPQAEIEQLLAEAQQQMDNRRFTAPASGNALNTYRRILELQPDHPTAKEGIQRITAYYRDIAQQSLQEGRLDESLAYINRGLRATPKNDTLLNLRQQVQQAQKAEQREQEERQQAAQQVELEDMQRQRLEQFRREQSRRQQEQQPWWGQPSNYNESSGFNQR